MKNLTVSTPATASDVGPAPARSLVVKSLAALVPLVAFTTFAHATLLLSETFDSRNTGDLNGQNGWTANTAVDVATGGLSYSAGTLSIAGGSKHAQWTNLNVQGIGSKTFDSQSGEVWFSLTINVSATTTNSRFWFYVSDDADLNDAGAVGQIYTGSNALGAASRIGSSQTASTPTSLNIGNTLFIVGRFSQSTTGGTVTAGDYDMMEMWVNPTSTTLGVTTFTALSATGTGIKTGIDTFALSALTASGTGATVLWDNLLVGTTQADVLNVYAIPEPSAFAALGGVAALGLAALQRRRRRA